MSTVTADFPDFFRGESNHNTAALVAEVSQQKPSGTVTYGPFYVPQWEQLALWMLSADASVLSVDYYADQALTQHIGNQTFACKAGNGITDMVPIVGPWVQVSATFHTGAGTVNASIVITALNGDRKWPAFLSNLTLLTPFNSAVGASASIVTDALFVTTGAATLTVNTNAVVWTAQLDAVDNTGAIQFPVARLEHPANGNPCTLKLDLPSIQTTLTLTNSDAAARSMRAAVIVERFG